MSMKFAILLTIAVSMVVLGIIRISRRDYVWGGALITIGLLIGPGGFSLLD